MWRICKRWRQKQSKNSISALSVQRSFTSSIIIEPCGYYFILIILFNVVFCWLRTVRDEKVNFVVHFVYFIVDVSLFRAKLFSLFFILSPNSFVLLFILHWGHWMFCYSINSFAIIHRVPIEICTVKRISERGNRTQKAYGKIEKWIPIQYKSKFWIFLFIINTYFLLCHSFFDCISLFLKCYLFYLFVFAFPNSVACNGRYCDCSTIYSIRD